MRLHDFTEAESDTANAIKITATLRRAGYKKLGSGVDATVWTKDGDTVIKILMPDEPGDAAVNTFMKFYEFCQQHRDLPCLPRFREIGGVHHTPFVIGDTEYTQIAMERLYPIPDGSFDEAIVWILSDLAVKPITWEQAAEIISDAATWEGFAYPKKVPDILRIVKQLTEQDIAEFALLFKVMQLLYATGRINQMGWDLHTENVMQRTNGTLVIVDPWFTSEEYTA